MTVGMVEIYNEQLRDLMVGEPGAARLPEALPRGARHRCHDLFARRERRRARGVARARARARGGRRRRVVPAAALAVAEPRGRGAQGQGRVPRNLLRPDV